MRDVTGWIAETFEAMNSIEQTLLNVQLALYDQICAESDMASYLEQFVGDEPDTQEEHGSIGNGTKADSTP